MESNFFMKKTDCIMYVRSVKRKWKPVCIKMSMRIKKEIIMEQAHLKMKLILILKTLEIIFKLFSKDYYTSIFLSIYKTY